jgi:hypothetical protein
MKRTSLLFTMFLTVLLFSCSKETPKGCYECRLWGNGYEETKSYCNEADIPKRPQDPNGNDLNIHCEKQ